MFIFPVLSLKLLQFAAGDFHKKYVSESPLNTDKNLSKLRASVLSKHKPKFERQYSRTKEQQHVLDRLMDEHAIQKRSFIANASDIVKRARVYKKHNYTMTPDMHQALEGFNKSYGEMLERHKGEIEAISPSVGTKWFAPKTNYKSFIEHDIATNLYRDHNDYHAGLEKRKSDLAANVIGSSEQGIEAYKKDYRTGLLNNKAYMAGMKTRYHKVRQNMAEELGYKFTGIKKHPIQVTGKREIIQAGRKFKGTLPKPQKGLAPMTESQLADFRNSREGKPGMTMSQFRSSREAHGLPTKKVGLAGKHRVGELNAPPSPVRIAKFRNLTQGIESRLNTMIESTVARRAKEAEGFKSNFIKKARENVIKRNPSIRDSELHNRVNASVNHILHGADNTERGSVPISGTSMVHHANSIGVDVNEAEKARTHYNQLTRITESDREQKRIRSSILKRGSVFKAPRQVKTVTEYPALRKLSKGTAIGAGILGGAYLAKRFLSKKKEEEFSGGKMIKDKTIKLIGKNRLVLSITHNGRIVLADVLKTRPVINFESYKNKNNPIFKSPTVTRKTIQIKDVISHQNSVDTKTVKKYRKEPGRLLPTVHAIGDKYMVEDGNHRIAAMKLNGKKSFKARVLTPRVVKFDVNGQRTIVTKDRYVKQIKNRDLASAGSNYLRSAAVGAGLGAILRKKMPLSRALSIGAGTGIATQAATRIGTSKTKDQFGERSWQSKIVDRAPWAAGGAAGAGILAKRHLPTIRKIVGFSVQDKDKPVAPSWHDIATGGIEGGAGVLATDRLIKKFAPEGSAVGKKLLIGAGVGGLATGAIGYGLNKLIRQKVAAHRIKKNAEVSEPWSEQLSSKLKSMRFEVMTPEERAARRHARRWSDDRLATRGEEIYVKAGRGKRLARDLYRKLKGKSNVDERGREQVPEWQKPWAKKALAVAGIAAILGHRKILQSQTLKDLGGAIKSGAKGVEKQSSKVFPRTTKVVAENVRKVGPFYNQVKEETQDVFRKYNKLRQGPSAADQIKAKKAKVQKVAEDLKKSRKAQRDYENLSSRLNLIRFAVDIPYWDVRDERGRSARVYAPGNQARQRRKKEWYEKKANRDIIGGGLVAAALGGGYGGKKILADIEKKRRDTAEPLFAYGRSKSTKSVTRKVEKGAEDIGKKFLRMLSSRHAIINFKALLP